MIQDAILELQILLLMFIGGLVFIWLKYRIKSYLDSRKMWKDFDRKVMEKQKEYREQINEAIEEIEPLIIKLIKDKIAKDEKGIGYDKNRDYCTSKSGIECFRRIITGCFDCPNFISESNNQKNKFK